MRILLRSSPIPQLRKEHDRLLVKRGDEILEAAPMIKVDQAGLMGRGGCEAWQ